jgi:lipopolysaccharide transport system ATP-binding protein
MTCALTTENIGKSYTIGHMRRTRTLNFRETLVSSTRSLVQRLRHPLSSNTELFDIEEFWALRDINLTVAPGERVGLIGRNGAGKSTLLKILSRITEPTTGRARLYGRISALLQIGTGFHPELTGRENIFLNGAVLGMRRREIQRKFDEIVAFSEVEQFLDTPVKRYSSGMYVRLAFAVAAHLDPEILLVDEVLAVGDIEFQKKCLGRMNTVADEGRTILFVSHNMAAISRLCNRVVLLDKGRIVQEGDPETIIQAYFAQGERASGLLVLEPEDKPGAQIEEIGIVNDDNQFASSVKVHRDFSLHLRFRVHTKLDQARVAISVLTQDGTTVFVTMHTDEKPGEKRELLPGSYRARVRVPAHFLNVGTYSLNVQIIGRRPGYGLIELDRAQQALNFRVEQTGTISLEVNTARPGVVTPILPWSLEQ